VEILEDLSTVSAGEWNRLGVAALPFLRYEFLRALEVHGCLGERFGWLPRHILVRDAQDRLVAACPLYLKFNAYGEFVFDCVQQFLQLETEGMQDYMEELAGHSPYRRSESA